MKIVVDANRIFAATIKDSTTREILLDLFFEFIAPDFIMSEIRKNQDMTMKKAEITKDEFEFFLSLIFERIKIIPESEYSEFIDLIKDEINDPKDVPYLAACLASKAYGIWTHDPDFNKQNKAKVLTNIDMLRLSGKAKPD